MKRDALTELLNKMVAICETLGRGTYAGLASDLGCAFQQVSDWLVQRKHKPSARIVLALQEWAAKATLRIARNEAMSAEYRKQFKIANLKYPGGGGKKA